MNNIKSGSEFIPRVHESEKSGDAMGKLKEEFTQDSKEPKLPKLTIEDVVELSPEAQAELDKDK